MVQNFKNLKIYKDAFQLSKELYLALESKRMSFRTREQIWASASSICANIAEMGAFESKSQQKQKMIICIAEANETEFWLYQTNHLSHMHNQLSNPDLCLIVLSVDCA